WRGLSGRSSVPVPSSNSMLKRLQPGCYYGYMERRYDLGGLILSESVFPSGLAIPRHERTNRFFCFVLEGWGTTSWDHQTWLGGPSTLTLFLGGLAHANRWGNGDGRVLNLEFARPWLRRIHGPTAFLERPAEFQGGALVWLAHRLLEEHRNPDDVSSLAVEGL